MLGSCKACEALREERDHLRAENSRLLDTVIRLSRKGAGLPEVQPEKREAQESIPERIRAKIEAWGSPATQQMMEKRAWSCYKATRDWDTVSELLDLPADE